MKLTWIFNHFFNQHLYWAGSTAHVQTGSEHILCAAPEGLLVGCTGCSESFSNLTHATHHSGCYKVRNCLGFLFLFYSQPAHTALPQMSVFREREKDKKMVWCGLKWTDKQRRWTSSNNLSNNCLLAMALNEMLILFAFSVDTGLNLRDPKALYFTI